GGALPLAVLGGFIPPVGIPAGVGLAVLAAVPAEELVQEGEGGGAPVVLLPVRIAGLGHQALHPLGPAEGGHHLVGEVVQVLVGDAHFLHHIINGLDAKLPGALETETFVLGLAALQLGNKDHRHILVTAAAHSRLHTYHSFPEKTSSREKPDTIIVNWS